MPTSVSTSVASGSPVPRRSRPRLEPRSRIGRSRRASSLQRNLKKGSRGVSRPPASRAQGLLASDVCASTNVFAPKLGRETVYPSARHVILSSPPPPSPTCDTCARSVGTLHWDETDRQLDARRALARHQSRPCATSPLTQGLHITNGPFGCCRCRSRTDAAGSPREQ